MTIDMVHILARVAGVPVQIAYDTLRQHGIPIDEEWTLV